MEDYLGLVGMAVKGEVMSEGMVTKGEVMSGGMVTTVNNNNKFPRCEGCTDYIADRWG